VCTCCGMRRVGPARACDIARRPYRSVPLSGNHTPPGAPRVPFVSKSHISRKCPCAPPTGRVHSVLSREVDPGGTAKGSVPVAAGGASEGQATRELGRSGRSLQWCETGSFRVVDHAREISRDTSLSPDNLYGRLIPVTMVVVPSAPSFTLIVASAPFFSSPSRLLARPSASNVVSFSIVHPPSTAALLYHAATSA
jgi:hypothetical protein